MDTGQPRPSSLEGVGIGAGGTKRGDASAGGRRGAPHASDGNPRVRGRETRAGGSEEEESKTGERSNTAPIRPGRSAATPTTTAVQDHLLADDGGTRQRQRERREGGGNLVAGDWHEDDGRRMGLAHKILSTDVKGHGTMKKGRREPRSTDTSSIIPTGLLVRALDGKSEGTGFEPRVDHLFGQPAGGTTPATATQVAGCQRQCKTTYWPATVAKSDSNGSGGKGEGDW